MSRHFDQVAVSYHNSLPHLPKEYINLIKERFSLKRSDKIIDLGCGTGLLTIPLSRISMKVQGLDSSSEMIGIALAMDHNRLVEWKCCPVEDFYFGTDQYDLIISFESFHLFKDVNDLIPKCVAALKAGGHLCVGWCKYHWEDPLKDIIVKAFALSGINWGEWSYQCCPEFASAVRSYRKGLSSMITEDVRVQETTHIRNVALYLSSIDKTTGLEKQARLALAERIEESLLEMTKIDRISGLSSYAISYCKKL
jgi:trans-aconitate methyltransferase